MIAEIIPEVYDAVGRQVSQPFQRRKGPHPTFPMGRYIAQPLSIECKTFEEVRAFLSGCKYVSDEELFGKREYWQPPEEFEKRRKGDCEDFALWTWRQLLNMGYEARFIGGACGRYGSGHAWVEFVSNGKWFLLEPLFNAVSTMPRLSTYRYSPAISVAWDGKTLKYFSHKRPATELGWARLTPLVAEYLIFWTRFWSLNIAIAPKMAWRVLRTKLFRRDLWSLGGRAPR